MKLKPTGSQSRNFMLFRQLRRRELKSEERWSSELSEPIVYLKTERLQEVSGEDDGELKKRRGAMFWWHMLKQRG